MGKNYTEDRIIRQMGHDSSDINQKLWSRKKLKIRRDKNEKKRVKAAYFKNKDNDDQTGGVEVSDKQKEFYQQLFKKDDDAPKKDKKKKNKNKKAEKVEETETT